MHNRENILRAVRFEKPEYIPLTFHINAACWHHYSQNALQELMASHPLLFPDFKWTSERIEPDYRPEESAEEPFMDGWGCVWETLDEGITGLVIKHPLESWDDFTEYKPPNPNRDTGRGAIDWDEVRVDFQNARLKGCLARGELRHGHTFLTLVDIRGYENLILDMATEEPRLLELVQMVEEFNLAIVNRYVEMGAEWIGYPDDLGMQVGPMLSPSHFRKYIKQSYQRIVAPAKEASCIVHMHSDGDIRELVDDLIEVGVEVINLQDLVNGIDWIRKNLVGRICIDLDIDRQKITHDGTPAEIDALIHEEVSKLSCKDGGLLMTYGLYPGIPLENIKALMDAMERYAYYH
jgi:uroporphyrinogen decarboxylase